MMIGLYISTAGGVEKSFPQIIEQASKSVLGIFALMVLLLGCLAYVFFRKAPVKTKQWIFLSLFLGVVLYGFAITKTATSDNSPSKGVPTKQKVANPNLVGTVIDADTQKAVSDAQISVDNAGVLGNSDHQGEFHFSINPPRGNFINMRVAKSGYEDYSIGIDLSDVNRPPLMVQLSKSKQ